MQEGNPFALNAVAASFGLSPEMFLVLFLVLSVWTLAVKGYALWFAAQHKQKVWFIFLLAVNTFGILELAYLLFFRPKEEV